MSDIGLSHGLTTDSSFESEHLDATTGAVSDGALHASEDGVSYDGSAHADATYSSEHASGSASGGADASASADGVEVQPSVDGLPDLPVDTPELPEAPDLADLPEVPDTPELPERPVDTGAVEDVGGGVGVDGGLEGWLDAMGALMAEFAASVSAMIGL